MDSRSLLRDFRDLALKAADARDVLVDVIEEAFETGDVTLPNNGTQLEILDNRTTLPPVAVTAAKFKFGDVDLQQKAKSVADALYALEDMIQGPAEELKGVMDTGEDTCNNVANGLDDAELRALQLGFGI